MIESEHGQRPRVEVAPVRVTRKPALLTRRRHWPRPA